MSTNDLEVASGNLFRLDGGPFNRFPVLTVEQMFESTAPPHNMGNNCTAERLTHTSANVSEVNGFKATFYLTKKTEELFKQAREGTAAKGKKTRSHEITVIRVDSRDSSKELHEDRYVNCTFLFPQPVTLDATSKDYQKYSIEVKGDLMES